ncbi:MAG: peptidase [Eggerthellaceae bacterium]|nr:peptidase [Eggerthellaceae bacterium]
MDFATIDERDAFLLGNQGPDPLFFAAIHPALHSFRSLGSRMHKEHTTDLVRALHRSLGVLDAEELPIGRAYAQGFLGHFALDSTLHPLVYATQYAICDAGIDGLSRADCHEVHAEIEREFDEMVLTAKRRQTVRDYPAVDNTLEASPETLAIIQKVHAYLALSVYGIQVPPSLFPTAVECYRIVLATLHSPFGIKRSLAAAAERTVRPHSFIGAMAHRAVLVEDSWFANSEHTPWTNPYTGEVHTASFWDLYQTALDAWAESIDLFGKSTLTEDDARTITRDVNFSGEPTVATLVVEG